MDPGGGVIADSVTNLVGEEDINDSSFCPDSLGMDDEELLSADSTEVSEESSKDEVERIDVIDKDSGFLADFFVESDAFLGETNGGQGSNGDVVGQQREKSVREPKIKYSRR